MTSPIRSGILPHPEHGVELADEARQAFARLDDAAIYREIRPGRLDVRDPGRGVADIAVADVVDLALAGIEEAPGVGRVVELGPFELVESIDVPGPHLGHGMGEPLVDGRPEPGLDDDLLRRLAEHLERPDPGVEVRGDDRPIKVIMGERRGVGRQAELAPPALDERAPEEIGDGNAVGLLMAEALFIRSSFFSVLGFRSVGIIFRLSIKQVELQKDICR